MWYVKRNDETSKGEKIGGTNLIGREERRSMRLSGTRNMNRFLVRTCLLGITVLKYDLIALLVPWNLAQHSINYGNARFDYIIIILWNLIYFPTFCVFIFIYIYSEIFEFSKRSKQRFSKACLLKKKRSRASFRYAARKHATLSIFASHPPASECTVSTNGVRALGETRFFESYFCQTEIKV